MGSRGPKPGFKQARAEQAASATPAPDAATVAQPSPVEPVAASAIPTPVLSASDRENPDKLSGQALRDLAHRRGIAKSILPTLSDEKIRTELRYATYRQYEDAVA